MWVLHEGRITDFPGGFDKWETASAERAHAASVASAEEEALRRVHERQQTRRTEEARKLEDTARRSARQALESAEDRVTECEAKVAAIRAQLEDPALYTSNEGSARAQGLGKDLEAGRVELEQALREWEVASEKQDVRSP
jgi:ATPase subunit of ABC transporter with duplicated ATPase domains